MRRVTSNFRMRDTLRFGVHCTRSPSMLHSTANTDRWIAMLKYSTADMMSRSMLRTRIIQSVSRKMCCVRSLYSLFPLLAEGKNVQVTLTVRVPSTNHAYKVPGARLTVKNLLRENYFLRLFAPQYILFQRNKLNISKIDIFFIREKIILISWKLFFRRNFAFILLYHTLVK